MSTVVRYPHLSFDTDGTARIDRTRYTDLKNYLRSLRYGAAQIDRIFSGSMQTALQASVAASRKAQTS